MGIVIGLMLAALAAAVLLAVMLAPAQEDESYVMVKGEPLAIEAPSLARHTPREVEHVGTWDEVDQHWGEAQWMMAVG